MQLSKLAAEIYFFEHELKNIKKSGFKDESQEQLPSDKLDVGDHRPQRQVHLGGGHT